MVVVDHLMTTGDRLMTFVEPFLFQRMLEVKKKELEKIILDSGQSKEDFESALAKVLDADGTNVTIQKDMIIEEHITMVLNFIVIR